MQDLTLWPSEVKRMEPGPRATESGSAPPTRAWGQDPDTGSVQQTWKQGDPWKQKMGAGVVRLACPRIRRTSDCGLRQVIGTEPVRLCPRHPQGLSHSCPSRQTKPLCERLELCKETVMSGKDGLEKEPESRIPVSQAWIPTPSDAGDISQME